MGKTNPERFHEEFVTTQGMDDVTSRSINYLSLGFPVHLTGPTGVGKTATAIHIARELNRPFKLIHGHPDLTITDLVGGTTGFSYKKVIDNYIHSVLKEDEQMRESWIDGHLLEAAKSGYTIIYDDFTRSRPEINNILLPILEEKVIPLYGMKKKESFMSIHPQFSIIFTSNPKDYVGVYDLQDSLMDRMITFELRPLNKDAEISVLSQKVGVSKVEAQTIVGVADKVRGYCDEPKHGPSLRASITIASIAKETGIPIDIRNMHFQVICQDVLGHSLNRCNPQSNQEDLQRLIFKGYKN